MIFPLFSHDEFGRFTGQVLGVLIGMGFGLVLERAGFGKAENLAAQFYGGDNRVLKVMFTGIATTAALLGLCAAFGLLDLSQVTVPETYLWPQIVGGLLLGVGFVVAGFCPGTGVVAAATGSVDGLLAYGGVMLGTFVFGFFWSDLEGFYSSGSMGVIRLDQWLGVSFPVVAAGVVAMAITAFLGAERLEAWLAKRRGTSAPDVAPRLRNLSLVTVAAAAGIALFPSWTPAASASATPSAPVTLAPTALAEQLVADARGLWIVDLRDPAACAKATVPGALCRPAEDKDAVFVNDLAATRPLVVVADAGAQLPAAVTHWPGEVRVLDGGYAAFDAQVLTAPTLPAEPTLAQIEAFQRTTALQGYFTGAAPAPAPVVTVTKAAGGAAVKKGGGC